MTNHSEFQNNISKLISNLSQGATDVAVVLQCTALVQEVDVEVQSRFGKEFGCNNVDQR